MRYGRRHEVETYGSDDGVRWVLDRNGRKVREGDLVDVPHEGEKTILELDLRDCGEDDARTGLPTVSFKLEGVTVQRMVSCL